MKRNFVLLLIFILSLFFKRADASSAVPIANFVASKTSICEAQCINFTDLSTNNPTSWTWSFQGASVSTSTQQHPSNICYFTSGTYFVSLTVSNASGSNTLYLAGYITVYPSSVVNLLANGDFNNYNTGFTSQLTYVPTGTLAPNQYSVDTNAYYHNTNWAGISPDTTPFFMSDGSQFTGTVVWSENSTAVFPSSAYTFSFLMTNLDVNHSFVMPELLTTVTDQGGTVLFSGTTGLLPAANSNVPPVYVWTPFSYIFNTLANTTSITITLSQIGGTYLGFDFALEDMYLKTHFCDSLAALPSAGLFTDESLLCPGSCASFLNQSANAVSYQWFFPGGTPSVSNDQNPAAVCYNSPGNFDVTLIATNANGSDTITIPGYITVLPYPAPQGISQNGDTLFANQGAVSYQWFHDGILITGATDYYYVATGSGNFNVVAVDVNGCQVEAAIFDVVAGIESANTTGNSIRLFPNPVVDQLIIDLSGIGNTAATEVRVLDILAKPIYTNSEIQQKQTIIDCKLFPSGIYFLELTSSFNIFRFRFIKQ